MFRSCKIWLLVLVATSLPLILTGCQPLPPNRLAPDMGETQEPRPANPFLPRPPYRVVVDNQGGVCAYANTPNEFKFTISTGHAACLSSSCTKINEKKGDIQINADRFEIRLTALFDTEMHMDGRVCTEDCGGAGQIKLDSVTLTDGHYSIWLGDNFLGRLIVPATESSYHCFDSSTTPTPTLTPIPATTTPTITPTPPAFLSPLVTPVSPLTTPTSDL